MTEPTGDQIPEGEPTTTAEKTFTQTQLDKIISNRLPEYDAFKSKADQFDALTKTTEDTLISVRAEVASAKAELAKRDVLLARQEIAAKKGLDPNLWSRVNGETQAEIEADIGELIGFSGAAATRNSTGRTTFVSGASSGNKQTDKERAVAELRALRSNQ